MTRSRPIAWVLATLLASASLAGCRAGGVAHHDLPSAEAPVVLFFGDSITRGHGLTEAEAFPALIENKLAAAGLDYRCVNAGVSGDTTESALARIEPYVRAHPRVVMIELGANDGWKGINRLRTMSNLSKIVRQFSDTGARVIVAGTQFPHLQHPAYALSMGRVYEEVAKSAGAELIPDLMTGVASVRELNLEDGLHPNPKGQQLLAETAWPAVERAIASLH